MGWRYRKRIKIAPGIHVNFSKSGVSTTIGPRGASVNIGKSGTYLNTGIPGTGLYNRQKITFQEKTMPNSDTLYSESNNHLQERKADEYRNIHTSLIVLSYVLIFFVLFIIFAYLGLFFNVIFSVVFTIANTIIIISLFLYHLHVKNNSFSKEVHGQSDDEKLDSGLDDESYSEFTQEIEKIVSDEFHPIHAQKENTSVEELYGQPIKQEVPLAPYEPKLDLENYKYPTLNLLNKYTDMGISKEELQQNKNRILRVLWNFGIEITTIKTTFGPRVILYEITLAPGINVKKLYGLEDDIALILSARDVRIIAPIPGKGTVGIEVPNPYPYVVSMESLINCRRFQETDFELPIALCKTVTNEVFMFDLAKAPHVLIAGSSGQGKSVALHVIITSLLYKKHPSELKFVLIDPRIIEFSVYEHIANHFLAEEENDWNEGGTVISDQITAVSTLRSCCVELDIRYSLMAKAHVHNINEYNHLFKSRQLNPRFGHKFMPYIVIVIDSFSDISSGHESEFEKPLLHLAKLGRAAGIHIVLATGRPSSDIVTSEIKTYFPVRIAFRLPEKIDSRVILDTDGAEQLQGNGDMIFRNGSTIVRAQCAFMDSTEVDNIVDFIAQQQGYSFPFPLPEGVEEDEEGSDWFDVDMAHLDPMFEDIAHMVVAEQIASTSMIQRKFSIGYNRAGRLLVQLEKAGIVGPAKGSRTRDVLCKSEDDLISHLENLRH
ncbi:MAG: DUF4236 domain-containing protein [Bacteroidaceae bacterium]|nr:DUF4236 domain-containing protein [Bacteroidaceae bacterium]